MDVNNLREKMPFSYQKQNKQLSLKLHKISNIQCNAFWWLVCQYSVCHHSDTRLLLLRLLLSKPYQHSRVAFIACGLQVTRTFSILCYVNFYEMVAIFVIVVTVCTRHNFVQKKTTINDFKKYSLCFKTRFVFSAVPFGNLNKH